MRTLIAISVLLACISAQASNLDYFSGRKWVEQQCATNVTQDSRLFVGRFKSPRYASILPFRKGITLREIIDQSPLRGKVVMICVMRPDYLKSGPFTRRAYIVVKPSDAPDYEVKSLDVIWLYDEGPIIET